MSQLSPAVSGFQDCSPLQGSPPLYTVLIGEHSQQHTQSTVSAIYLSIRLGASCLILQSEMRLALLECLIKMLGISYSLIDNCFVFDFKLLSPMIRML